MFGTSMGHRLVLASYGESHGACVGALLSGCPAGLPLDEHDIQPMLDKRRPGRTPLSTQRKESDLVEILSGVYRGRTTGAPIAMIIRNSDQRSSDYDEMMRMPRPGHSDYPAGIKYGGYNDHRGGGIFSGRLTATQVMGGAIASKLLRHTLGIRTCAYTLSVGSIKATASTDNLDESVIYGNDVRCPDQEAAAAMADAIMKARGRGDTLGGIIKSVTTGIPTGLGSPIYNSLESDIAAAVFSIPSVKGVEFGTGFAGSYLTGSENNDPYIIQNNTIRTRTNNAGGILGGLSTGMPLVFNAAFKPASSIAIPQDTVDMKSMKESTLQVRGRHDPCVVPRAPPVVDSMVSLVIADHALMAGKIEPVVR